MIENIQPTAEDYISIFVPMTIKKRSGRGSVSIITPQHRLLPIKEKPKHDFRLINALAKAYRLQQKRTNNSEQTISALAEKEGLHAYTWEAFAIEFTGAIYS